MSSIEQESDNATLTGMTQAQGPDEPCNSANLQAWERRLASRSAQLAAGRQGAAMQQVMDDLRD